MILYAKIDAGSTIMDTDSRIKLLARHIQALPPKMAEKVADQIEPVLEEYDREKAWRIALEWLQSNVGRNEVSICDFDLQHDESGIGIWSFCVRDVATSEDELDPIGCVNVRFMTGEVLSTKQDAENIQRRVTELRVLTEYKLNILRHPARSKELSLSDSFARDGIIAKILLTKPVLSDLLIRALTEWNYIHLGQLLWDRLCPHVEHKGIQINAYEIKEAAKENFRTKENWNEFESSAWWWNLRVAKDIEDPTAWVIQQHKSGLNYREIGEKIILPSIPGTASAMGTRIVKQCSRVLEERNKHRGIGV